MEFIQYNEKLKKSIQQYRVRMDIIRKNRSKIIYLNEHKINQNNTKQTNIKACKAKKNNGEACPSIVKKNSEFCHRHFQIFIIKNELKSE